MRLALTISRPSQPRTYLPILPTIEEQERQLRVALTETHGPAWVELMDIDEARVVQRWRIGNAIRSS